MREQLDLLKSRFAGNEHDSSVLNEIIVDVNSLFENMRTIDLISITTSLRKAAIKQIIDNAINHEKF